MEGGGGGMGGGGGGGARGGEDCGKSPAVVLFVIKNF